MDYYSGVSPYLVNSLPTVGSDYWKSDTMFDLRYCNWNKDMLMGVLPNSQFGDVAVINVDNSGDSNVLLGNGTNLNSKLSVASAVSSNTAPVPLFALDASSSHVLPVGSTLHVVFFTVSIYGSRSSSS